MEIQVCTGKKCSEKYSKYIKARLENDIAFDSISWVHVSESLCMGKCKMAPNVKFGSKPYEYMSPLKASEILAESKK